MPSSYNYKHISTAATFNAIAGAGSTLGVVTVNTGATGAILTLYDSLTATGNVIATIDAAAAREVVFACRLKVGLTAVQAVGAADITITYE